MSKVIKVNTDQTGYKKRLINYDRFNNMPSDSWDHEAVIGESFVNGESQLTVGADPFYSHCKSFKVYANHGGTVANKYSYPARTSAVLAIECIEDGKVVVLGAQIPGNKATRAGAAAACLAGALGTGWVDDARWLWDSRSQKRKDKAWFAIARAYETIVARAEAAA